MSEVIDALMKIREIAYEGQIVAKFLKENNIPYNYSISYVILMLYHYYKHDRETYNDILKLVRDMYKLLNALEEEKQ